MPNLYIRTNMSLNEDQQIALMNEMNETLSKHTGNPEDVIMVSLSICDMTFGKSTDPCAFMVSFTLVIVHPHLTFLLPPHYWHFIWLFIARAQYRCYWRICERRFDQGIFCRSHMFHFPPFLNIWTLRWLICADWQHVMTDAYDRRSAVGCRIVEYSCSSIVSTIWTALAGKVPPSQLKDWWREGKLVRNFDGQSVRGKEKFVVRCCQQNVWGRRIKNENAPIWEQYHTRRVLFYR